MVIKSDPVGSFIILSEGGLLNMSLRIRNYVIAIAIVIAIALLSFVMLCSTVSLRNIVDVDCKYQNYVIFLKAESAYWTSNNAEIRLNEDASFEFFQLVRNGWLDKQYGYDMTVDDKGRAYFSVYYEAEIIHKYLDNVLLRGLAKACARSVYIQYQPAARTAVLSDNSIDPFGDYECVLCVTNFPPDLLHVDIDHIIMKAKGIGFEDWRYKGTTRWSREHGHGGYGVRPDCHSRLPQ